MLFMNFRNVFGGLNMNVSQSFSRCLKGSFFFGFLAMGAVVASCGKDDDKKDPAPAAAAPSACDSTLKFADVESILSLNCAGCHGTNGGVSLGAGGKATLAAVTTYKAKSLERIKSVEEAKVMPPKNTTWKDSADGKKVISYLSCDTLK